MGKVQYGKYGKDERVNSRELINIYQRLVDALEIDDEFYDVKMKAYTRRKNELSKVDK